MENAKVYFTDFKCSHGESLPHKLERLVKKAGIENIDFKDKFVAIKLHFGEPGNMAYLRPQYAAMLCELIKSKGGKPFLTDCNTLYVGGRKNALDHLESAAKNGYNPLTTGVQCIIADGLKGTEERIVPVENGVYVKEAKIGSALMDADIVISLTHFKGHVEAGFGGCLKNLGMGGGSRRGKLEMHSAGTPMVKTDLCIGCGMCARNCAHEGVKVVDGKAQIQEGSCVGCGRCLAVCPKDAIMTKWDEATDMLNFKIAEYAWAILNGRPNFHISLVQDVSPDCDCEGSNDIPIIPDVGMFASFDPVAIDQACFDACNEQPLMPGSMVYTPENIRICSEGGKYDVFHMNHPNTKGEACLEHGEKLGMGTRDYELVTMK